jgi:hypothetical protein
MNENPKSPSTGSKEISSSKLQNQERFLLGIWSLGFLWDLELGSWNL